jgi:hypothetical protein
MNSVSNNHYKERRIVPKLLKGVIAGLVATAVLTVLMMMKKMMGVMPELDPVHMMSEMVAQKMGMDPNIVIGWIMHFGIGSIAWGVSFVLLNNILPGKSQIVKGISLGIGAWFLMMIGPMPMSGAGLFGMNIGMMAPVMTLMLHIIFGVVLGTVFVKLKGSTET